MNHPWSSPCKVTAVTIFISRLSYLLAFIYTIASTRNIFPASLPSKTPVQFSKFGLKICFFLKPSLSLQVKCSLLSAPGPVVQTADTLELPAYHLLLPTQRAPCEQWRMTNAPLSPSVQHGAISMHLCGNPFAYNPLLALCFLTFIIPTPPRIST